jgi:hypothetical protein
LDNDGGGVGMRANKTWKLPCEPMIEQEEKGNRDCAREKDKRNMQEFDDSILSRHNRAADSGRTKDASGEFMRSTSEVISVEMAIQKSACNAPQTAIHFTVI